ncbi:MAG: FAD binding domain-containing protein [Abditibacteriales bacterium]|nr:FAD binding domain-containing protein [Abditibacteriales bacterium]
MHRFEYLEPTTLDECAQMLAAHQEKARLLAGGTDLIIQMEQRKRKPEVVIYAMRVPELSGIRVNADGSVRIGATTTLREIETSPVIKEKFPVLSYAASTVGSVQIRNLATIGGNVCNASPAGDTLPPLLVLGTQARMQSVRGERVVPLEAVFTGPGQTCLAPDEFLVELIIPAEAVNLSALYYKQCVRQAMDIAVVGVGVAVKRHNGTCEDVRIALGAVAPIPFRAKTAEEVVRGQEVNARLIQQAAERAQAESRPIDDVRGSAAFRREMVLRLVRRGLNQLLRVNG